MTVQRKKPVLMSPPSVADLRAQLVKRGMVAPMLSVVVPVKNEEEAILPFVERVGAVLDAVTADGGWEILFVDDGSSDATLAASWHSTCPTRASAALSLSRNFGKEAALSAGLDHARGSAVSRSTPTCRTRPRCCRRWSPNGVRPRAGVRPPRSAAPRTPDQADHRRLVLPRHQSLSADTIPQNVGDFRLLDRKVVDVIGRCRNATAS